MVIIIVWITILMCAIGAVALYIVKGNKELNLMVLFMKNTLVRYWWNVKSWWLVIPDLGKMIIVFILICAIQLFIMYSIFGIPDWFEWYISKCNLIDL